MRDHSEAGLAVLGDLGGKVDRLEDGDIVKIARLLEAGGDDPKALKGRAILRPRLRRLRPVRRLNARRLFCVPFEMLLSDDQSPTDPVRRIPRAAIWPAWPLVEARMPKRILQDVEQAAAAARSPLDKDLQRAATALWEAAAHAIETNFDAMAAQLGEAQWLRDMAGTVGAHQAIGAIRELLKGGGLDKPGEALAQQIAGHMMAAVDLGEDMGFAAGMVAAAHFRSPASLVNALLGVGVASGPGLPVARRLCDALGADLDRGIAAIQAPDGALNPAAVVAGMTNLVDNLQAMQSFAKQAKDPMLKLKVEQAMLAARSATVDDMLPRMRSSVGDNLDRAVSEMISGKSVDSSREVESNIVALRKARPSAEFLGAGAELAGAVSDLLETVKAKAEADPEDETDDERTMRLMTLARLVELLESPDAAQVCLDKWMPKRAA